MTSRRDRALLILATIIADGDERWLEWMLEQDNLPQATNEQSIAAILAFADAELERAARYAANGGHHPNLLQEIPFNLQQAERTAKAIRAVKEE